ncbi:GNAT family N-acetyltransferase [Georgenia sunbinii]|uniref:GNAT family N-acetyltransferase n=1 Tax=Georgenia sunbinii TaxID=3117728 RepID=UPI002F2682B5
MTEPRVDHVPARDRYEAHLGDELAGVAEYERRGDVVVLTHTVVEPAAEDRGVGSALARTALDAVRAEGLRARPQCSFMAAWIERHPDYADLVADQPED